MFIYLLYILTYELNRLTPVYMIALMFEARLTAYIGSGPLYPNDGFEKNKCEFTWWTNALYLNNFVDSKTMVRNQKFLLLKLRTRVHDRTHRINIMNFKIIF